LRVEHEHSAERSSPAGPKIRRVDAGDASRVAGLCGRLFRQSWCDSHPVDAIDDYVALWFTPERVREELSNLTTSAIVVSGADDEWIGYALLRESTVPSSASIGGQKAVELARFYIDSRWHGKGIAQSLMESCVSDARGRGADVLWLQVWQQALRAIAFYRKSGFSVVGATQFRVGSQVDDDHLMARRIEGR
jgi:diamine N-acetyltransferase